MRSVRMDDGGSPPVSTAAGIELAHPARTDRRTQMVAVSLVVGGCILAQESIEKYSRATDHGRTAVEAIDHRLVPRVTCTRGGS